MSYNPFRFALSLNFQNVSLHHFMIISPNPHNLQSEGSVSVILQKRRVKKLGDLPEIRFQSRRFFWCPSPILVGAQGKSRAGLGQSPAECGPAPLTAGCVTLWLAV